MTGWVQSDWKKSDGQSGDFGIAAGDYYGDAEADKGLKTTQDARFYAISKKFDTTFDTTGKTVVIQYSVKHTQKIDCGGSYLKVLPAGLDQADFKGGAGESPYNIMFGPDVRLLALVFSRLSCCLFPFLLDCCCTTVRTPHCRHPPSFS
jgi:calreticulin